MSECHTVVAVNDASQVGEARRQAVRIAETLNLSESDRGRVAIVASELATNLARYATAGEILLRAMPATNPQWIELLAVDRGPGITDVTRSLEDGYSTGGTAGTGLGAARRLSNVFDIYSTRPGGTVVFCRLQPKATNIVAEDTFVYSAISRPAPLEVMCGDSWRIVQRGSELAIMIVDGLGHGPSAASAADEATAAFDREPFVELASLINSTHVRMQGTRGGAIAIAHLDADRQSIKYVGVGNISGHLRSGDGQSRKGLVSHNGTVGVLLRRVQHFDYAYQPGGLLVMHSDGVQSRWSLDLYPGLSQRHPAVIAGVLQRDFTRGRDDVTVAVVKLV